MAARDSQRSLERWGHEAGRCQNPCGWAGPFVGPWAGCGGHDLLGLLFQRRTVVHVGEVGWLEDERELEGPTAAEDHLVVVGVGMVGHRAAAAVAAAAAEHHKEAEAAAGRHREPAAGIDVERSWDGSSEEAGRAQLGVDRAEAELGVATAVVAADGAGHWWEPELAVGVEAVGMGRGVDVDRRVEVEADVVVAAEDCSHTERGVGGDSRDDHQRAGDCCGCGYCGLLCHLLKHILHDPNYCSGMPGIAGIRKPEPAEEVVEGVQSCRPWSNCRGDSWGLVSGFADRRSGT